METNKVFAAILLAGLVAMLSGFIAEQLMPSAGHGHGERVRAVAIDTAETDSDAATAQAAPEIERPRPIASLLAEADIERGETAAAACRACHSFDKGGANRIGPNLWGVVGRGKAARDGFNYSSALAGFGGVWSYSELNEFFYDPQGYVPGTSMAYAGIENRERRAALIAWLRTLADEPEPLPEAEAEAEAEAEPATAEDGRAPNEDEGEDEGGGESAPNESAPDQGDRSDAGGAIGTDMTPELARRLNAASAEDGESAISACMACHSFEKGGPSIVGPNLWGVVSRPQAEAEGFSYSPAYREAFDGRWTYSELDRWLADPMGVAPGTRMAYPGIRDEDERADVIRYLRSLADSPAPLPQAPGDAE